MRTLALRPFRHVVFRLWARTIPLLKAVAFMLRVRLRFPGSIEVAIGKSFVPLQLTFIPPANLLGESGPLKERNRVFAAWMYPGCGNTSYFSPHRRLSEGAVLLTDGTP